MQLPNDAVATFQGIMNDLAVRFGSTGADLWQKIVEYTVWKAQAEFLMLFIFTVSLTSLSYFLFRGGMKADVEDEDSEPWYVGGFVSALIAGILFILCVIKAMDAFLAMKAPEAYTLMLLLNKG